MEPAGLYVHVPFCSRVCPYCDFAVQTGGPRKQAEFLEALLAEIESTRWEGPPFDTLYLGGGTPSALAADDLARVVSAIRRRFPFSGSPWITLEANPEDVNQEAAARWLELGVGTVSLGVQAFDDAGLRFLGRRHDAASARAAEEACREAGVPVVSIDLIFGLPGQSPESWAGTLRTAVALAPEHISCYQLTIHEGTRFGRLAERGQLDEMPDDEQAELFLMTHRLLQDSGYRGYEVSNFAAAPRFESRHNRKYWRHVPYLGLGPSAHSFDGERRWWNLRRLRDWAPAVREHGSGIEESELLRPGDLVLEALMFGLRTRAGVDLGALARRHAVDLLQANAELIERLGADGLIELEGTVLRPTLRGMVVAEWLVGRFEIPSPAADPPRPDRRPGS